MILKPGDKIKADLGGSQLCSGIVSDPNARDFSGKPVIEFWAYHGWKHLEICREDQVVMVNGKKVR